MNRDTHFDYNNLIAFISSHTKYTPHTCCQANRSDFAYSAFFNVAANTISDHFTAYPTNITVSEFVVCIDRNSQQDFDQCTQQIPKKFQTQQIPKKFPWGACPQKLLVMHVTKSLTPSKNPGYGPA